MIKGSLNILIYQTFAYSTHASVMSGIITGPHFRKYFDNPGPLAEGTMVAVLEVGAFSMFI